jgi:hypothetical protein
MRYKNKKYLAWLAQNEHECVMCGHEGWDDNQIIPHHAISIPGLALGGTGMKASDTLAMPMHVKCHIEFHAEFHKHKEEQPIWLMKSQERILRLICNQTRTFSWTVNG